MLQIYFYYRRATREQILRHYPYLWWVHQLPCLPNCRLSVIGELAMCRMQSTMDDSQDAAALNLQRQLDRRQKAQQRQAVQSQQVQLRQQLLQQPGAQPLLLGHAELDEEQVKQHQLRHEEAVRARDARAQKRRREVEPPVLLLKAGGSLPHPFV